MKDTGLRHLRVLLTLADCRSVTGAAHASGLSQPAVTQALQKLETAAAGALFERSRKGLFTTPRGDLLIRRVRRALARLDPALALVAPRLVVTATTSQLTALVAVIEAQNFTIAAQRLGVSQPTVHRAIAQLETEVGKRLFDRATYGIAPTRASRALGLATRLAFAELDQAAAELAELDGRAAGQVVVGALPLSRSALLPQALALYRTSRPRQTVTIVDGAYGELLSALRRGEIDFILGAMRDPVPIADVKQEPWFDDSMCVVASPDHPLAGRRQIRMSDLADYPWVVARQGTPAREQFESRIAHRLGDLPVVETGSILLMRGLLQDRRHLGCASLGQAAFEIASGQIVAIDLDVDWVGRPIGLTTRIDWLPTAAQQDLLETCRRVASHFSGRTGTALPM